MLMMRESGFTSRSFITLRNQRGYGTQKNWMSVRQELLYYTKGSPGFTPQYTDIPKALKGYYKEVNGRMTENTERGRGDSIRAGNVWIDVQQVFYWMEENVNGSYAQKPLKAITRIIEASSSPGDTALDFFSHSGTTLLAAEMTRRRCLAMDIDPIFCEITIRRLENFRLSGRTGWQNSNPFAREWGRARERASGRLVGEERYFSPAAPLPPRSHPPLPIPPVHIFRNLSIIPLPNPERQPCRNTIEPRSCFLPPR